MKVSPSSEWKLQYLDQKPVAEQPLLDESLMKFSEISVIADERRNNGGSPRMPPNSARAGWSVSSISNSQGNDSRHFDEEESKNSPRSC